VKDPEARKRQCQVGHRNKKPSGWRDYFDWMVRYAAKVIGPNDACAVANEALLDAYRSEQRKPAVENEQEVRRWLSCLIIWRARAHRKRERRWKGWDPCDLETQEDSVEFVVPECSDVVLNRIDLLRSLDELSLEERTMVFEHYVGGFSASELAVKYQLKESTVRTRLNRATTKLFVSYERRQKKSRPGQELALFVEPFGQQRFAHRFIDLARTWSRRLSQATKLVSMYASCALLVVMMPGDLAARQTPPDLPPEIDAEQAKAEGVFPIRFIPPPDDVFSIADQRKSIDLRPSLAAVKPTALPPPVNNLATTVDHGVDLTISSPQAPEPMNAQPNAAEACGIASAKAQTAFNLRGDAKGCLEQLNSIPAGFDKCPENYARAALRLSCQTTLRQQSRIK